MGPVWIVIADTHHGRIYAQTGRGRPLVFVDDVAHAAAALKSGDITTDKPGMRRGDGSGPRVNSAVGGQDPKETEQRRFAEMLAKKLEHGRATGAFQELVLF